MLADIQARMAYSDPTAPVRTARSTEAQLFQRITRRLREAVQSENSQRLAEALHENRRIWRTVAILVADEQNGLPAELRARLFSLHEFTDRHTSKVLAHEADPAVLIDINTAVMRGLAGQGGGA